MTDLVVEMCICCVNIRTNLDSFATTLWWDRALQLSGSLKQEHSSHSEYGFISLYCNRCVSPFYPLIGIPIVKWLHVHGAARVYLSSK